MSIFTLRTQLETNMKLNFFPIFILLFIGVLTGAMHSNAETHNNIIGINSNIANMNVQIGRFFGFFAKNRAEIEFEFATKNIYGVDGSPQTPTEKDELSRMEDYFKNHVPEMVGFKNLDCTYKLDEIDKKFRKKIHNNVGVIQVEYKIACSNNIPGHDLIVNLGSLKNIEAIRYTIESNKINHGYILGSQGEITIP